MSARGFRRAARAVSVGDVVARVVTVAAALSALVGCRAIRNERLLRERDAGAGAGAVTPATTAEVVSATTDAGAATGGIGGTAGLAGTESAEAKKRAWLTSPLSGRDNNVAAFRLVRITADPTLGFKLFVKNEFGLTCGLAFGADGDPASTTTPCVGDDGWHAKEPKLTFACSEAQGRETCRARYTLVAKEGFADPAALELVRVVPAAKP